MSFIGRNNAKISNQNSGGGNKLQGLPPTTNKRSFVLKYINRHAWGPASTRTNIVCMNQLGGVGPKRSQFISTADGIDCSKVEEQILQLLRQFIAGSQGPLAGFLTLTGAIFPKNGEVFIQSAFDESKLIFRVIGLDANGRSQQEDIIGPGEVVAGPYNGLVLFTPNVYPYYTYLIDKNATSSQYTDEQVLDNLGGYLNRWGPHPHTVGTTGTAASAGYLTTNGELIYPYKWNLGGGDSIPTGIAAQGGGIIKYDWNGTVLWNWTIPVSWGFMPHHDIEPIPNGNILMIVIEYNSYDGTSDGIIEIEPISDNSANLIWTWKVTDHLDTIGTDPYKFSTLIRDGPASSDWNHFNSVYMSVRDTIYLSSRNWNEFFVIPLHGGTDSTGDILYRWGHPENYGRGDASWNLLDAQHGVNEISSEPQIDGSGNVILFNNGGQMGDPNPTSQILEIEKAYDSNGDYTLPATDPFGPSTWTWKYDLTLALSSNRQSGAFRLPNGNTFGISAQQGYMFEVDKQDPANVVWDFTIPDDIRRAHQYPTDYMPTILSRNSFGRKIFSSVTAIGILEGKTSTGIVGAGLEITIAK